MKKILLILLALIIMLTMMAGCTSKNEGGSDALEPEPTATNNPDSGWDYVKDKGELIVGLDDTFAPMGFRDDKDDLVGFDIDLANAVGEILDVKIKFQPISWDAKEMELSSKRIDCIWNGMSATPERKENMALTNSYLNNKIVIMGKDAKKITSLEDLKGKKIGTQAKSAALEALEGSEIYKDIKSNVTEMPTYDEVILDMKAGRIDVMIVDEVLGQYKNKSLSDAQKMEIASVDFGDDFYAVGCRKGEISLADKLNEAIQKAIDDGKAKEISEKWFGADIVLDMVKK